jgi:hypothetical protein
MAEKKSQIEKDLILKSPGETLRVGLIPFLLLKIVKARSGFGISMAQLREELNIELSKGLSDSETKVGSGSGYRWIVTLEKGEVPKLRRDNNDKLFLTDAGERLFAELSQVGAQFFGPSTPAATIDYSFIIDLCLGLDWAEKIPAELKDAFSLQAIETEVRRKLEALLKQKLELTNPIRPSNLKEVVDLKFKESVELFNKVLEAKTRVASTLNSILLKLLIGATILLTPAFFLFGIGKHPAPDESASIFLGAIVTTVVAIAALLIGFDRKIKKYEKYFTRANLPIRRLVAAFLYIAAPFGLEIQAPFGPNLHPLVYIIPVGIAVMLLMLLIGLGVFVPALFIYEAHKASVMNKIGWNSDQWMTHYKRSVVEDNQPKE